MKRILIVALAALITFTAQAANVKISELPAASALTGVETAPVVQSAATVGATVDQIKAYVNTPVGSYQTPTTGFTITIASGIAFLNLNPAGSLLAGTINMPAVPVDGQVIEIASTQTITTLTVSGNGSTILNAPTTITAGTGFSYRYRATGTTWYRRY